jgi:hypothetical protein
MGLDETYGQTWSCEAVCDKETQAALHVILETGEVYWVPKSVVDDDSEVYEDGHEGILVLKYWWAEKEGLA